MLNQALKESYGSIFHNGEMEIAKTMFGHGLNISGEELWGRLPVRAQLDICELLRKHPPLVGSNSVIGGYARSIAETMRGKQTRLRRLLHITSQLSNVHLGDTDVFGKLANEAQEVLKHDWPEILCLENDPECDYKL